MPRHHTIRRAVLLMLLAGAKLPLAVADAGHALNYTIRQSLTHDDNVFRLPEGVAPSAAGVASRSDTVGSTEVGAVFDRTYGIQRLKANLGATALRYRNNSDLGSEQHNAGVGWLWRSGNRLDGELSWSSSSSQSSFADLRTAQANVATTTTATAGANYWFHSDWTVGIRGVRSALSNSSDALAAGDSESLVGQLNLRYQPASGNSVSIRRSEASGRYPNRQLTTAGAVDNGYTQRETSVDFAYRASGASDLSASFGQVDRQHRDVAARNFRGTTGRISWNWQVTGQTRVSSSAQREIGAQNEAQASYTVSDALSVGIDYAATAKAAFSLAFSETRRDFKGDPQAALAGTAAISDTTRWSSVGTSYAPLTRLQLSLSLREERRGTTEAGRDYRSRQVVGNAAYQF